MNLSGMQIGLLDEYKRLLIEWSVKTNLLSQGDLDKIEDVHFADSLAPVPLVPAKVRIADWGSGAGLPGIPLAIARPDIHITLVESRQAKAGFLLKVSRELELSNVTLFPDDGTRLKECFDLVTVRAVGTIKKLLPILLKKIVEGGGVLFYKGPGLDEELEDARGMIERSGLRPRIDEVTLPSGRTSRYIFLSPPVTLRNTP